MSDLSLKIYARGELKCAATLDRAYELGRQQHSRETLYAPEFAEGQARIVIASEDMVAIPRRLLRIEPRPANRIRITNIHDSATVSVDGGQTLQPRATIDVHPGCLIPLKYDLAIRIEASLEFQNVATPSLGPAMGAEAYSTVKLDTQSPPAPGQLIQWFQAVTTILQNATTAQELYEHCARAVVRLVGMDNGAVVLWNPRTSKWTVAESQSASGLASADDEWLPSQRILAETLGRREPLYHVPTGVEASASMQQLRGLVAAPILAENGSVVGVVYGDRRRDDASRAQVTLLDAQLVQTLAVAVGSGLVRFEKDRRLISEQTRFEQFFSVELARSLAADPQLLDGRDADISCLFADIRGFSRVSERLGARQVTAWIQAVLDALSECVSAENGVLVDYIGDELFAMWGAPQRQEDHAARACAAGRAMQRAIPVLNAEWSSRLGGDFGVGIGVHTGPAFVGNTGSRRKFKYGPLGNTVNLASRIQGATKYLRTGMLVTGATRDSLPNAQDYRRLCQIRVVNIERPVELFDIGATTDSTWQRLKEHYELALTAFEARRYQDAMRPLLNCLELVPNDGPSIVLLSRVVTAIGEGAHDDAWVLPGK
ncbi:MAG: hypothetical protein JSS02_29455 [Planctomycetes bacterium]|nr:hypothetical protein [Planctomycetota bacterium]